MGMFVVPHEPGALVVGIVIVGLAGLHVLSRNVIQGVVRVMGEDAGVCRAVQETGAVGVIGTCGGPPVKRAAVTDPGDESPWRCTAVLFWFVDVVGSVEIAVSTGSGWALGSIFVNLIPSACPLLMAIRAAEVGLLADEVWWYRHSPKVWCRWG